MQRYFAMQRCFAMQGYRWRRRHEDRARRACVQTPRRAPVPTPVGRVRGTPTAAATSRTALLLRPRSRWGTARSPWCFQKYATAIAPEPTNAANRVPTPAMIAAPPISSIIATHHDGQAPNSAVTPEYGGIGHPNSVDVPWHRNRNPTTMRNTPSAQGAALSSEVSITLLSRKGGRSATRHTSERSTVRVSRTDHSAINVSTPATARYTPTQATPKSATSHVAMNGATAAPRIDATLYAMPEPV